MKRQSQRMRWAGLELLGAVGAAGLLLASGFAGAAEDNPRFSLGGYEISGAPDIRWQWVDGERQSAKFNEYRDVVTGLSVGADLRGEKEDSFLHVLMKGAGGNDQEYRLAGGEYGLYRYKAFYNQTPHNYSFNALTFYDAAGIGTNTLTYSGAAPTASSFVNPFDYAIVRKDLGAEVRYGSDRPFFVDFGANRVTKKGVKPLGIIISATNRLVELPAPVDTVTNNAYLETGYRRGSLLGHVRFDMSSFSAANDYLTYKDAVTGTSDVATLAPANTYNKLSAQAVIGDLPLDSHLNLRGSLSWLKSDVNLFGQSGTTFDTPVFHGDMAYRDLDISVSSRPLERLSAQIHYKYLQKTDDSTLVTVTSASGEVNQLYWYKQNVLGVDFGYRLPFSTKLTGGYEFTKFTRAPDVRNDVPDTWDNLFFAKFVNHSVDWTDLTLRIQYLSRHSSYGGFGTVSPSDIATNINAFIRPFDAADKTMWKIRFGSDLDLVKDLDLSVEYNYRINRYNQTVIGRTFDQTNEAYLSAGYKLKGVRFTGFLDAERSAVNSSHRYMSASGYNGDPTSGDNWNGGTNTGAFNWSEALDDLYWGYGLGATIPLFGEKAEAGVSWSQNIASGSTAFNNGVGAPLKDIPNVDNARHSILDLHGSYHVTRDLTASLGYLLDQRVVEDFAYEGYSKYVVVGTGTSWLTGAYNDHDYMAHVFYISASYRM